MHTLNEALARDRMRELEQRARAAHRAHQAAAQRRYHRAPRAARRTHTARPGR